MRQIGNYRFHMSHAVKVGYHQPRSQVSLLLAPSRSRGREEERPWERGWAVV